MRVTNNMNYNQVKTSIEKNRSEMSDLQTQAATMKRITKPSDDPVGTSRTLAIRTDKKDSEQFIKNAEQAKTFLNTTESALASASELLVRAKELAIGQSSSASSNAYSRLSTATEVDQMFKDTIGIANSRFGERYVFGGYKTMNSPFDADGNFRGDSGAIRIEVSKGVFVAMNMSGDSVFHGKDYALAKIPEDHRGANTPNYPDVKEVVREPGQTEVEIRGPASVKDQLVIPDKREQAAADKQVIEPGENVFSVMRALSNGLKANDTVAIEETLERIDNALEQVVTLRSQIGSRIASLANTADILSKQKIDNSALLSSIEDADAFELFTDITKNESTLKATLQSSGKLIQPSLLDFIR